MCFCSRPLPYHTEKFVRSVLTATQYCLAASSIQALWNSRISEEHRSLFLYDPKVRWLTLFLKQWCQLCKRPFNDTFLLYANPKLQLRKVCHKQTTRCHANSLDVTSRQSNQRDLAQGQNFITKHRGTHSSNWGIFYAIIKEVTSLLTDRFDAVDCVEICDLCSCVLNASWIVWKSSKYNMTVHFICSTKCSWNFCR